MSKLGKNVGDDFREFKITLPIIESVATGNTKTYEFWKRTLGQGNQNEQDFSKAVQILQKDGSLEKTRSAAIYWANKARNELMIN